MSARSRFIAGLRNMSSRLVGAHTTLKIMEDEDKTLRLLVEYNNGMRACACCAEAIAVSPPEFDPLMAPIYEKMQELATLINELHAANPYSNQLIPRRGA